MESLLTARVLHVLAVVIWIGGVAMVTTAVLPAARRCPAVKEGLALFEAIEGRFAWQARLATLVTGASGFYLAWELDLWDRFRELGYWWMHAMVALWAIFMLILFIIDPFFLHRWLHQQAATAPARTFRRIAIMHWLLLAFGLITIAGAVAGSHGAWFG
ncbi:MAG: hypothetical protein U1E42_06590 [Rhodospirillales bacterium]